MCTRRIKPASMRTFASTLCPVNLTEVQTRGGGLYGRGIRHCRSTAHGNRISSPQT
jgi:hypothetical protein